MTDPLVSILINNYNYGRYLDDAVSGALSQTYPNVEVIVVDDGSTDDSRDVLKKYEGRAKIILKDNGGQASAFNAGFAASKGDIICFLDADDTYKPEKITTVVETFNNHPGIEWCFDRVLHTDEHLTPTDLKPRSGQTHFCDYRDAVKSGSLKNHLILPIPATSGLSFKRTLLAKVFPIPESESCSMCENYMKYIAVGTATGTALDTSLTLQRLHGKNLFTTGKKDPSMDARISIMTGYWLNKNFPALGNFADTQIAWGLSLMGQVKDLDPKYAVLVKDYLTLRGLSKNLQIKLRAAYYQLKRR